MSVATLREQFTKPLENVVAINMLSTMLRQVQLLVKNQGG